MKKYNYSQILKYFKLYEYIYESAKKELDDKTKLVSYRTERIVIEYPDDFIKKYFPSSESPNEDIREMLYWVLRSERLSFVMWTDDNRSSSGAGKDTIHVIKPDHFSVRITGDMDILLEEIFEYERVNNGLYSY